MYKKLNYYKKKYYLYKSILICNVVYNGVHVKLANYRYKVKEHMQLEKIFLQDNWVLLKYRNLKLIVSRK